VCAALSRRRRGAWPLAIALLPVLSAGSGVGAAGPVAHAVLINPWAQQNRLSAADAAGGDNAGLSVALSGTTAVVGVPGKNGSTGAAYVFVHSGTRWYQQARLTAGDGAAGDQFGSSVALSGDAAMVGAPFKNAQTGAAYVFVRRGTGWYQQARLTAGGAAGGDWFGSSVALNGSTALVGAPQTNSGSGAAYVFVHSGTDWRQQARLTAGDAAAIDDFGSSVALNGSTALIGAPQTNSSSGAAYVFMPRGTGWHQQARLTAGDAAANDELGTSVALSGNTAVVGAPGKNTAGGAAYVFVRHGTGWHQQAQLAAGDAAEEDNVGLSVAVSADTAVAGAPGKNGSRGAAYVFVRSGTTWRQQNRLTAGGAAGDELGTSVALRGNTALVGAPGKSGSTGAVYVLVSGGTHWSHQARPTPPTAADATAGDRFGFSMAVAGADALVGAPGKDSASGAAYVFVPRGAGWLQQARLSANDAAVGDRFGFSVASAGDAALVGAPDTNRDAGAAYVFAPRGANWLQQARLSANDATAGGQFGFSAALAGDTALVGAPGTNGGAGAAYVFVRRGASWRQQARLSAGDATAGGQFGFSAALAGDTALVGAPGTNGGAGAAYVFVRRGTRWSQQARLSAGDTMAGDELGTAVSLSGNTTLVGAGAPFNTHAGAAYVFVRSGTRWRQQARLTASDGAAGDQFGLSVALSGSTAMVGAPFNTHAGAVYVFVRRGTGWRQQVKLTASDGAAGDQFGLFVTLSGATGLVGAPGQNTSTGVTYVFVHSTLTADSPEPQSAG
jgi:hypothetical protein